jgi:hypothetical protein
LRATLGRQNLRKHSFKNRMTDIWNDLPHELVHKKPVKSFELLLDKYWEKQEVKYDYNEEIKNRTGSHKKMATGLDGLLFVSFLYFFTMSSGLILVLIIKP